MDSFVQTAILSNGLGWFVAMVWAIARPWFCAKEDRAANSDDDEQLGVVQAQTPQAEEGNIHRQHSCTVHVARR